ncbi:unnamed protein product, partial [Ixodes hexagonus]
MARSHLVKEDFRAFRERNYSESSTSDESSGSFASCLEEPEERSDGDGNESRCSLVGALEDAPDPQEATWQSRTCPPSGTFFALTREFITLFTTLHFEHECVAGVYVCVICQQALRVLQKIRAAIRGDPHGRQTILNNCSFMKVLLNLCDLDAPVGPRICTVVSRDVRCFYQKELHMSLRASVELLSDNEAGMRRWQLFLGKAVETIKPLTYVAKFSKPPRAASLSAVANSVGTEKENVDGQVDEYLLKKTRPSEMPVEAGELSNFKVVGSLDTQHLWVYSSAETRESVQTLSKSILEFLGYSEDSGHRVHAPTVGSIVGVMSSSEHARRVLVLQVKGCVADVWAMDYGDIYQVSWADLVDLPPSFKCIPAQVGLCILTDVRAVPYLNLLKECIRTLRTLTSHQKNEVVYHNSMVHRMSQLGGFRVLCNLMSCPDQECRLCAIVCMLQTCQRQAGRAALSAAGCVPGVLGKLLSAPHSGTGRRADDTELEHVVELLTSHLQLLGPPLPLQGPWLQCLPLEPPAALAADQRTHAPRGRFYLRDTLADFECDATHELRAPTQMKDASARTLSKHFCSFLNTWRPCTLYYGITRDRYVRGVRVNHEERDCVRRGVDFTAGNLRPHLTSSSYSVVFVPVLRSPDDPPSSSFRSVVEVRVCGVPQTVYTTSDGECFLREGGVTYQATT